MKVLVLGGYGNFGARISRALAGNTHIELVVAGRDASRAQQFASSLPATTGVGLDMQSSDFAETLKQLGVGLVIHTAGPFQAQGYGVAQACAAAGVHYIDLADGRRFVCDFAAAVQSSFEKGGCVGVSGASTVPALSSAVVQELTRGWSRCDSIDICIAPAQTAPRGVATLAAVLSYCGEPISVWDQGRWQHHIGWADLQSVAFKRLRPRLGAPCDIPDLELFPSRFAVQQRVTFRAALEVGLAQRAFAVLAWLRSKGLLPKLAGLAPLLNAGAPLFDRLGTALGGMAVRVSGLDADGRPVRKAWHIAADNDHGPEIPCMAAILLARRIAAGDTLPAGAYACVGLHPLADFDAEFAKWGMVTDIVDEGTHIAH